MFTITSKSMTVWWSGQSDANSYKLIATPKNSSEQPVFTQFSKSTVIGSVISLSPNTVYMLCVEAMDSSMNVLSSTETEETTAPQVPYIVQAYSKQSNSLTVEFSEESGATAYILRAENKDGFFLETMVSGSPGTISNLSSYTDYTLSVMSRNSGGFSQPSYSVHARTVIVAPTLHSMSPTQDSIVVSWDSLEHAVQYTIYVIKEESDIELQVNTSQTNITFNNLDPGVTYCIKAVAWDLNNISGDKITIYQITLPCPPDSVVVSEHSIGNCSVTWTMVQGVKFYMVYVNRDDGAEEQSNTTNTIFYFKCDCGYTYITTVFVYNVAGISPPGPILNYTTVPCCPHYVYVSLISTETLEVTWSAVRGAVLYETVVTDESDALHCNDTMPICVLSDLTCNSMYNVVIRPCSDIRGCNDTCTPNKQETAPCAPEILKLTHVNSSDVQVSWKASNKQANYTVNAFGSAGNFTCSSSSTSCSITNLHCGDTYEVSVYATSTVGSSLPSYSIAMETGPCCPKTLSVEQVTQSMTSVKWSSSRGGWTYITSLSSLRGHAKCHTLDTQCLMGCITCGTNYSVSVEVISITGQKSLCDYHGFSSRTLPMKRRKKP
ncbi:Fibronectin type III domain-containing protein 7 [Bagarius yarrelli]|uniref:Fibronectin type III domain-containing protein 7 n=1 Tax=Bagarius yarrelli TaxID=175774 RepID=A0A556V7W9_BAGYA|nr:Fibronectin type III domain-containing protein 7 [Bagarius yarrelli]